MCGSGLSWRQTASAVIVGVALGAAGCGSDGDKGRGGQPARADESDGRSTDEAQIRKVISDSQRDISTGEGVAFCARLVESEQRDLIAFAQNISRAKTCPTALDKISIGTTPGRDSASPDVPRESVTVRINGDRATVAITNERKAPQNTLKLAKTSEGWKFTDAGFEADPLAAAAEQAKTMGR